VGLGASAARSTRSVLGHERDQVPDAQQRWAHGDNEQRREDEERQWEQRLDGQLAGRLLGALAALRPQQISMSPQRLRHAGTELVALDDEADEGLQVVGAVASTEPAERVGARPPVAQLERHL